MGFLWSQLFVRPAYPTTSFDGKTVIVTGSNTGLGKEAARHLARLGARVILAVRNTTAGAAAKDDIESTTKCDPSAVEVWPLDLSSYDSVRSFADRASKLPRLDVLLENAGIASTKFELAEGHERTVTVNVLSTFLLALLLLPKLRATAAEFKTTPIISIVSSEVHAWTNFPEWKEPSIFAALDDNSEGAFKSDERYPTSKLLEVLAVRAMAPRMSAGQTGSSVILNYLNPGLCHSELTREMGLSVTLLKFFLARSTEVGSRTLVAAAAAGPNSHGKYMTDAKVDDDALSEFARSEDGRNAAEKLWKELVEILEKVEPGVTKNL